MLKNDDQSAVNEQALWLRCATEADKTFLRELFSEACLQALGACAWDEHLREQVLQQQYEAHERYYAQISGELEDNVICLDEISIGRMMVLRLPDAMHLSYIELLPAYRGAGWGANLVKGLQEEAASAGKPLHLHVSKQSPAIGFYDCLGFFRISSTQTHEHMAWVPPAP